MSSVFINMRPIADDAPSGYVATLDDGRSYIAMRLGDDVSLSFPGFDGENLAAVRALLATLARLADQLDAKLAGRAQSLGTAPAPAAETEARPPLEPLRTEAQVADFDL